MKRLTDVLLPRIVTKRTYAAQFYSASVNVETATNVITIVRITLPMTITVH